MRAECALGVEHRAQRSLQAHVLLGDDDLVVGYESPPDGASEPSGDGVVHP